MGALEWLVSLYRTASARPRPDVRILELGPTGSGSLDFSASIQNVGTEPCRCGISATVGDRAVDCTPAIVDLLVNDPPTRIAVHVPPPGLRGAELVLQVNDGKRMTSRTWAEHGPASPPPPRTARS